MSFLLLVEGSDDKHLIKNVARQHKLDIDAQKEIRDCEGIEKLLQDLPVFLKTSAGAIAIVVDADLDVAARWQALAHRLTEAGYQVPPSPPVDGLILFDRRPAVGVWLMPDNTLPGSIEDFAKHLIPSTDELWPRAISAVEDIPIAARLFSTSAHRKAQIHTYLAWQESPGTPLGLAVTKRYFHTDTELCTRFVQWLRKLKELSDTELA